MYQGLLIAALVGLTAQANAQATSATAPTAAAPAATSTVSAPAAGWRNELKKTRFSLVTANFLGASSLRNNTGNAYSKNAAAIGYKLTDTRTFSVRQNFGTTYDWPTAGRARTAIGDLNLQYSDSKLFQYNPNTGTSLVVRLGLPTGESSRFNSLQRGWVMGRLVTTHTVHGRLDVSHYIEGAYLNNSTRTYGWKYKDVTETVKTAKLDASGKPEVDEKGKPVLVDAKDGAGNPVLNKIGEARDTGTANLSHYVTSNVNADLTIAQDTVFTPSVGFTRNVWLYEPGNSNPDPDLTSDIGLAVGYKGIPKVEFELALTNNANMNPSDRPVEFMRDDEIEYSFTMSLSL